MDWREQEDEQEQCQAEQAKCPRPDEGDRQGVQDLSTDCAVSPQHGLTPGHVPTITPGRDDWRKRRRGAEHAILLKDSRNSWRSRCRPSEAKVTAKEELVEVLLDLLWQQWTTLGVAGVTGVGPIAIDLEELLVLTAQLSPYDPRLRDEALDWCSRSHRFIAKPRLKQLVRLASETAQAAFAPFATALASHTGGTWPGAAHGEQFRIRLSGKSRPPDLEQPALINLRLRALFGVGARADIITAILNWPAPDFGASDLVFVGYTKRNLADALDALADGGLLERTRVGNRLRFSWRKRRELNRMLEPLPKAIPRWPPVARVVAGFLELMERTEDKSERVSVVEAVRVFGKLGGDLTALGLEPPRATTGSLEWARVVDWMLSNAQQLTQGRQGVVFKAA